MKKLTLEAQKRNMQGRKVKKLRQKKILPANVFGKKVTSLSVQVPLDQFAQVYAQAGVTGLVDLTVDNTVRPVLIHNVQIHPVTQESMHVDFYQVDLKQKVKAKVPVEISGVAPAVEQKLGLLLELVDEVEVEALPTDLPDKILVDVSKLTKLHEALKIADISFPTGITVLTDKNTELVKIGELVTKEAEALAAAEAAAKAAAQAETAATTTPAVTTTAEPQAAKTEAPKDEKAS